MRARALTILLFAWAVATAALCAGVHSALSLDDVPDASRAHRVIATVWARGARLARALIARPGDSDANLDRALAATEGATARYEVVTGEGPLPAFPDLLLGLSLAPGRDGLLASLDGRTEYVTPDDLLARQAYRHGPRLPVMDLALGTDVPLALALLGERFGTSAQAVRQSASLRRVRFARADGGAHQEPSRANALEAALAAAAYLARGVDEQGRYRFQVDGSTNQTLPAYDLPRHAGATYFLAQAAARSQDPELSAATLRAAQWLRAQVTDCGPTRCVADGAIADLGATALAAIAFAEIARDALDASYAATVADLAGFLRAQQRPDGEFMHRFDRVASRPIDVQLLYYSGEAALALSRAHRVLGEAADLDAATRGVAHLVGPAWSFFGSRYYFGEEHWTCAAMADLWDRSPIPAGLDFCLRWLAFWGNLQQSRADTPFDAEGAYGVGPVQVPPLTPVASRCEAGLATLAVARRAGVDRHTIDTLDTRMKRSLGLLLRQQLRAAAPSRLGLLSDPEAVDGAFPASEVDWTLRVDFAQHAGSALLAWAALP